MQICPNCKKQNRIGVVFCEYCGVSLIGDAPLGTHQIDEPKVDQFETQPRPSGGTDMLQQGMVLRLEIEGAQPILLRPKRELIFGRRDPATGAMPDVDLTPFAGYRMGVSRKHAALRQAESRLDLWDLGSSNGTYLNGVKLSAHHPNRIKDGDEIRLGQMVVRIFFQAMSADKGKTNTGQLAAPGAASPAPGSTGTLTSPPAAAPATPSVSSPVPVVPSTTVAPTNNPPAPTTIAPTNNPPSKPPAAPSKPASTTPPAKPPAPPSAPTTPPGPTGPSSSPTPKKQQQ